MVASRTAGQTMGSGGDDLAAALIGMEGIADPVPVGSGGAGTVFRAMQPSLHRTVAVKLMHDAIEDAAVRDSFERECQVSGMLSGHPGIIDVYGAGFTPQGRPYILMEFVQQGSLGDCVGKQGPMLWTDVVEHAVKMSGALETAHRAGILHRDIKPENILQSDFGEPLLADFGIAVLQEADGAAVNDYSWTVAHAAPELFTGGVPSVQTDLYALGSTLFTLLCGQNAFLRADDRSLEPVISRIVYEPVPNLRGGAIPSELCMVVEQLMAKHPGYRFRSAEELGCVLQGLQRSWAMPMTQLTLRGAQRQAVPFVAQHHVGVQETVPQAATVTPQAPHVYQPVGERSVNRSRTIAGVIGGAVLGFLLLIIVLAVVAGDSEAAEFAGLLVVAPRRVVLYPRFIGAGSIR